MLNKFFLFVLFCLPLFSPAHAQNDSLIDGTRVTADVDYRAGEWTVHYTFAEPQSVLILSRSAGGYRQDEWTAVTEGASLQTIGGFDTLVFETPTLEATFDIIPHTDGLRAEYTPFIAFADGGYAVFTGQFEVLPVESVESVAALEGNLGRWQGEQLALGVRMTSDQPLVADGEIVESEAVAVTTGGGSYFYTGPGKIKQGESFTGIIDTALPDWLEESFDTELGAIFSELEKRWGFQLEDKSTVLFAFHGYDVQGYSNKGGAIGSTLALEVSGSALREETSPVLDNMRWFFAHEAAHLYQQAAGLQMRNGPDSWMHEGSANTMAHQIVASMTDTDDYLVATYDEALKQCATYLEQGSLHTVSGMQYYAPYHCGDIIAVISAGLLPEMNLYDFWHELKAARDDGTDTTWAYFSTLHELGADGDSVVELADIVYLPLDEPRDHLVNLMEKAGLSPVFDEGDRLVSIDLPLE